MQPISACDVEFADPYVVPHLGVSNAKTALQDRWLRQDMISRISKHTTTVCQGTAWLRSSARRQALGWLESGTKVYETPDPTATSWRRTLLSLSVGALVSHIAVRDPMDLAQRTNWKLISDQDAASQADRLLQVF